MLVAAAIIMAPPFATLRLGDALIAVRTIGGVSALLIGALLIVCGLSLWIRPQYRQAAGVTGVLLSLVALVTSNLGGFLVGSLLGLVGGALALSWTDRPRRLRGGGTRGLAGPAGLLLVATLVAPAATRMPVLADPQAPPSGEPWVLLAERVGLDGVVYHGVVETVVKGKPTSVMRFTAESVRITGLVQVSPIVGGRSIVIGTPRGVESRAEGHIELLTLRLTGTLQLLGLIGLPVDFTPARPPPLVPPSIVLTDVRVVNALMRGDVLIIPKAELEVR